MGRAHLALAEVHAATLFDTDGDRTGLITPAEDYFRRGVDIFRELGNESELARGLARFGRYKLERGDLLGGRGLLVKAKGIFTRLGMKDGEDVGKMIGEL